MAYGFKDEINYRSRRTPTVTIVLCFGKRRHARPIVVSPVRNYRWTEQRAFYRDFTGYYYYYYYYSFARQREQIRNNDGRDALLVIHGVSEQQS